MTSERSGRFSTKEKILKIYESFTDSLYSKEVKCDTISLGYFCPGLLID